VAKVFSILPKLWEKAYRRYFRELPRPEAYSNFIDGIEAEQRPDAMIYLGVTWRVPQAEYHANYDVYEPNLDEIIHPYSNEGWAFSPIPGGLCERYEVYDFFSDEIIVMLRVPFLITPAQKGEQNK